MNDDVIQAGVLKEFFKFLGSIGTKVNVTPIVAAELMDQVSFRKMSFCSIWFFFIANRNGAWICFVRWLTPGKWQKLDSVFIILTVLTTICSIKENTTRLHFCPVFWQQAFT